MKKIALLVSFSILFLVGCEPKNDLKNGQWRGVIKTLGGDLPFQLAIQKNADRSTFSVQALNGEEVLKLDTATFKGDSIHIPMGIFDAELVAKVTDNKMTGFYRKIRSNGTILEGVFSAEYANNQRFIITESARVEVSGKWAVLFKSPEKPADTTLAIGVFKQTGNVLTGTFLTPTGDYRYLAGNVIGDSLKLSCFDGNHIFLFKAKVNGDAMEGGQFWSNMKGLENWTAKRNPNATLPDAKKLTFLKPGYRTFDFSFPDASGKIISMKDGCFKGKVTVVQIMGSWCPNCMDETKFLVPWYNKNQNRGVAVVGLGFEKSTDLAISGPKLERLKKRFNVPYSLLLAGSNDKEKASAALPMLNRVVSFPTTIFIDKKGIVREIHTGFSGPGTGIYYDNFVTEFNTLIDKLLAEK